MYQKNFENIKKLTRKASVVLLGLGSFFAITTPWGTIAKASSISSDLNFAVEGKNMWGRGNALFFSEAAFNGLEWDKTIRFSDPLDFVTLNGNTSGKIGLEYEFTISSGAVNINYPVQSTLLYPEVVERSKTIKLNSSFVNRNGSLLETFSPQATAKLELPFKIKANVDGTVDPLLIDPIPFSLIPNINIDETHTFFNLSTSNPRFEKDFAGFGKIEAHIPTVNTSGGLSGENLKSQGQDDFITLSLDVDKVASTLIPQLPQLEREFSIKKSNDDPVATVKYNLLDIEAKLKAGFQQIFEFIPGLKVKYLLENGQEIISKVGEAIVLTVPANVGDFLNVTATYFLDNSFTNKTELKLTPAIGVEAITGKLNILGKDLISFGPFYKDEFSAPSLNIPVFSNQFFIDGFPTFQEMFEIQLVEGQDFGDAPDTYKTTLAVNGPRYTEGERQRLGIDWDRESDGQPTIPANGDDISLLGGSPMPTDDEDGVIFGDNWVDVILNILRPGEHKYQLRAWWDVDKNGCFAHPTEPTCQGNELFIDDLISLTPGIYTKRYSLPFNPKDYYSRFRLTWEPLDLDVKPSGEYFSNPDCMPSMIANCISHGEVEDYAPVPEPNSIFGLFAIGGLGLIGLRKKR